DVRLVVGTVASAVAVDYNTAQSNAQPGMPLGVDGKQLQATYGNDYFAGFRAGRILKGNEEVEIQIGWDFNMHLPPGVGANTPDASMLWYRNSLLAMFNLIRPRL